MFVTSFFPPLSSPPPHTRSEKTPLLFRSSLPGPSDWRAPCLTGCWLRPLCLSPFPASISPHPHTHPHTPRFLKLLCMQYLQVGVKVLRQEATSCSHVIFILLLREAAVGKIHGLTPLLSLTIPVPFQCSLCHSTNTKEKRSYDYLIVSVNPIFFFFFFFVSRRYTQESLKEEWTEPNYLSCLSEPGSRNYSFLNLSIKWI